ncbi:unnamed protein product, partial [Amoebophrya sp. A25]|eukprot:GSA25T00018455001.1
MVRLVEEAEISSVADLERVQLLLNTSSSRHLEKQTKGNRASKLSRQQFHEARMV